MNVSDQKWRDLTKRGDTVERLKAAGLPCTGLRNYRPVMSDGSEPDIEWVRDILSSSQLAEPTKKNVAAPTPKKRRRKQK